MKELQVARGTPIHFENVKFHEETICGCTKAALPQVMKTDLGNLD
jgi:hypothetical protein